MDTYKDMDDSDGILLLNDLLDFDCTLETYKDLQDKYSSLHETYRKEIENSRKVKKNLEKCLKFYLKLCKKCEEQEKIIDDLEKNISEKIICLEECFKNQEKMKGLIEIYKTERSIYGGQSTFDLKKDKDMLLNICCKIISESEKTDNIANISRFIQRKFKKDLDDEKLNLLKGKKLSIKKELDTLKENTCNVCLKLNDGLLFNNSKKLSNDNGKELDDTNSIQKNSSKCKKEEEQYTTDNSCLVEVKHATFQDIPNIFNQIYNTQCCKKTGEDSKGEDIQFEGKNVHENDIIKCNVRDYLPSYIINTVEEKEKLILSCKKNTNDLQISSYNSTIHTLKSSPMSGTDIEVQFKSNQVTLNNQLVKENCNSCLNNCAVHNPDRKVSEVTEILKLDDAELEAVKQDCEEQVNINNSISLPINNNFYTSKLMSKNQCNGAIKVSQANNVIQCNLTTEDINAKEIRPSSNVNLESESKIKMNSNNKVSQNTNLDFTSSNVNVELNNINFELEEYKRKKCDILEPKILKTDDNEQKSNSNGGPISFSASLFDVPFEDKSNFITAKGLLPIERKIQQSENIGNETSNSFTDSLELAFEFQTKSECTLVESELNDEEISKILHEMSRVRFLSPIKDASDSNSKTTQSSYSNEVNKHLFHTSLDSCFTSEISEASNSENSIELRRKRKLECIKNKTKKIKLKEEAKGLVDSILLAMTRQDEEFKSNKVTEKPDLNDKIIKNNNYKPEINSKLDFSQVDCLSLKNLVERKIVQVTGTNKELFPSGYFKNERRNKEEEIALEKYVKDALQKFISSSISSGSEAFSDVKDCITALANSRINEDIIARVMVSIVFENVNEEVESQERPIPPLTKTQHRLISLLTAFKSFDPRFENIIPFILDEIISKLFPDKFFWPDDAVETSCRFYSALCKYRNDTQMLWKFCLRAMTDMKQRSCLVFFIALSVWPDILHNASTLKNNILAVTAINIFLHTNPEKNLNSNQKTKLLALKHLLRDYYGFGVEETIENYAQKILDSFYNNEIAAEKSLILLIKCREANWIRRIIFPKLLVTMKDCVQNGVKNVMGVKVLNLMKHTVTKLFGNKNFSNEAQEIISCISEILNSRKVQEDLEEKIVEVLLCIQHYEEAKKLHKERSSLVTENLRNENVNLRLGSFFKSNSKNRKNLPDTKKCGRLKKKKNKGKKNKGKKQKKRSKKLSDISHERLLH